MTAYTHESLLCPHCLQRPVAWVVPFFAPISAWDTARERVLACATPTCKGLAEMQAEANGLRLDTEPLTREVAEDITGDDLSEVAS